MSSVNIEQNNYSDKLHLENKFLFEQISKYTQLINDLKRHIKENNKKITDCCKHNFVIDLGNCDPCGPTVFSCSKCGLYK